jgi:hypothetical protein
LISFILSLLILLFLLTSIILHSACNRKGLHSVTSIVVKYVSETVSWIKIYNFKDTFFLISQRAFPFETDLSVLFADYFQCLNYSDANVNNVFWFCFLAFILLLFVLKIVSRIHCYFKIDLYRSGLSVY